MSTATSSIPRSVNDWIATPAPLNTEKHGGNARFSGDNSVVERWRPDDYGGGCVCYTSQPLPVGQVWQTTVLNTTSGWSGGLSVGVTATLPHSVPRYLPTNEAGSDEWHYYGKSLYYNHSFTKFPNMPALNDLSIRQSVGLQISTNGQLHLFIDGKHMDCVATDLPVNKPLWGAVDVCGRCTKIKSEMLSAPPQFILEAALREGSIPHRDDKFLFHGPGGVGKSSLIAMFLGQTRALVRVSTPVATRPLHLTPARDISNKRFTTDWKCVDYGRLSHMIAHTSNKIFQGATGLKGEEKEEEKTAEEKEEGGKGGIQATAADRSESQAVTAQKLLPKADVEGRTSRFFSKLSKVFKKSHPTTSEHNLPVTLEVDPDNLKELFSDFLEGLHDKVRLSKEIGEYLMSHSIHMLDSGGQPQFHELASIFLSHISGFICVHKLSECLSAHGEVVFFDVDGVSINEPYESYYTHEQVIRHDLLAIQSEACCTGIDQMPNLAFVGTFLDEQDNCPETPDQKDERLHDMITEILPEEMQHCVITRGGSLREVTFRVNARTPCKHDFDTVGRMKESLLARSRAPTRDLPLKWHGLEVAFHMLMLELGRQSLSRKECEFTGQKLGFDRSSFNAALDYLRQLNIISFYDVLPNVIFSSSQVILDKVTELVTYSLKLKKGLLVCGGAERKFLQQGILSLDFLKSPALSKHYIHDLFTPENLLEVFISLLVVSKVGAGKYLVPCVLGVNKIYPALPVVEGNIRSSFILHFSKKSPMFGVYCCTTSYLMSESGFKPLTEDGEVVQMARNSITFEMPTSIPGVAVILKDPLSSYLEVAVELPRPFAAKHSKALFPKIRDTLFDAVKKAMKNLHYGVIVPDLTFLCPESLQANARCSKKPHPSTLIESESLLMCTRKPKSVFHPVTEEQKMWLPKATGVTAWFKGLRKKKHTPVIPFSTDSDEVSSLCQPTAQNTQHSTPYGGKGASLQPLHSRGHPSYIQQAEPHSSHNVQGETAGLQVHDPLHYQTVQEPSSQSSHYTSQFTPDVSGYHKSFQTTTSVHHTRQPVCDVCEEHERNQSALMTEEMAPQTNESTIVSKLIDRDRDSSEGSQRQTSSRKRGTTAPPSSNSMGSAQLQSNASRQTNTAPNSARTLSTDDLQEVRSKIYSVAVSWRGIGLCLGLSISLLDITAANNRDVDSRLTAMLCHWLNKAYDVAKYGEPSWQRLRDAVCDQSGGNNPALADTI